MTPEIEQRFAAFGPMGVNKIHPYINAVLQNTLKSSGKTKKEIPLGFDMKTLDEAAPQ